MTETGRLVLAATPIGDPEDASPRLVRLLAEADLIAAEDTRRWRRLADALGVRPRAEVISYHEHNERGRTGRIVETVAGGGTVLVVTDAGMPSVSDPGLRAVRAVLDAGLPVTAAPGPSAVLTALALSGLPTDRFCFEGFPPRTPGRRAAAFSELATEPRTLVWFESPRRAAATVAQLAEIFGGARPAALCRELTKTYEEVLRAPLAELAAQLADRELLGEVTLVVAGHRPVTGEAALSGPGAADRMVDLVAAVRAREAAGVRVKEAVAAVATAAGVPKRALYDAVTRDAADR